MTISDKVPGGTPGKSIAAMKAGLAAMGLPELDVVVTSDFVATVRAVTGDDAYHDDRNGGSIAARTTKTAAGEAIVVANWETLSTVSDASVERVLAHEAGHASINGRDEAVWEELGTHFAHHYWDFQVAYGATVAIDEYRCEAAVYGAGYPLEFGRNAEGLADDLFGLNMQLLKADYEYQSHLDVERLRDDVLRAVIFHLRYMSTIAARHLHHAAVEPQRLNKFAWKNWETLVAPTWERFVAHHCDVPPALEPWSKQDAVDASVAIVSLTHDLAASFGFEATADAFWIRLTEQQRRDRLDRANGEADLLDSTRE